MRRSGLVVAAAILLSSAGVVGGTAVAAPQQAQENRTPAALDWQLCEKDATVECASMTVPIDWARPSKGTIDVVVVRTEATDPANRIGTLVYMPGGPGDSGVNRLLRGNVVPAEVAARFDVVSYDPRGTNRSNPIVCDAELVAAMPNLDPEAGARLDEVKAYAEALGDSCREHTGSLVDHVDNVSVARDIDALRAALGERKVTLYGRSYGTLAGQMYAENFPHRVRGLVLDSVFDHSLTVRDFLVTEARAGEDSFQVFAQWCATDTTCSLHGRDVAQVYSNLYDKAVRGELTDPEQPGTTIKPLTLAQEVLSYFYGPRWPEAADRLKALADQQPTPTTLAEPTATVPFPIGAFCTDHRVRISSQAEWLSLWQAQNRVAPVMRTHFAWAPVSLCSAWPTRTPNPQHPTDIDRGVPTVLIQNSLHDPATGYEWATSVARQIDDSVLLTYDGSGHGVMDRTDCTRAVFTTYVVDRRTPRPGTHCAAAEPATADTMAAVAATASW